MKSKKRSSNYIYISYGIVRVYADKLGYWQGAMFITSSGWFVDIEVHKMSNKSGNDETSVRKKARARAAEYKSLMLFLLIFY